MLDSNEHDRDLPPIWELCETTEDASTRYKQECLQLYSLLTEIVPSPQRAEPETDLNRKLLPTAPSPQVEGRRRTVSDPDWDTTGRVLSPRDCEPGEYEAVVAHGTPVASEMWLRVVCYWWGYSCLQDCRPDPCPAIFWTLFGLAYLPLLQGFLTSLHLTSGFG